MPRPTKLTPPEVLRAEDLSPLVGAEGPDLSSALFALTTWGTSTRFREQLMSACDFPLPGDLAAFLLVNQLIYRGVARPTDLADAIDTGRSNISKVVARLEASELVFRAADPADDRAVVVALTDHGRSVARRILAATEALHMPAVEHWSPEEIAILGQLLVKLARSLDALPNHPLSSAAGVSLDTPSP
ncbi:MarR family winged helix-turn-helix transcriptional regulator [Nonomuraea sp. NPDC052129]|uniref:MarR family winged helix-turn-helix transcriptional regulator n=1 Tax=unclassified Nonomuraea TaxID=2593643 RepID=UPI0033C44FF5